MVLRLFRKMSTTRTKRVVAVAALLAAVAVPLLIAAPAHASAPGLQPRGGNSRARCRVALRSSGHARDTGALWFFARMLHRVRASDGLSRFGE